MTSNHDLNEKNTWINTCKTTMRMPHLLSFVTRINFGGKSPQALIQRFVRHDHSNSSIPAELRQILLRSMRDPVDDKRDSREHAASIRLSNLSHTDQMLLRRLKFEYEIEKAEKNQPMPNYVPHQYWLQLMKEKSFNDRMDLYEEIYNQECKFEKKLMDHYQEYINYEKIINSLNSTGVIDDTFIYTGDLEMHERRKANKLNNSLWAWKFGQPIVFEYSPNSTYLTQILHCLQLNQNHASPLNFHLTNLSVKDGSSELDNISAQNPFVHLHTVDTKVCFPKERLVYICDSSQKYFNIDDNNGDIPVFTEFHDAKRHDFGDVRTATIPVSRFIKLYDYRDNFIQYMLSYKFGCLLDYYLTEQWAKSLIDNLPVETEAYTVEELLDYIHKQNIQKKIKHG